MWSGIIVSVVLVTATLYMHFRLMRACAHLVFEDSGRFRRPVLLVMAILFSAHVLQVVMYTWAYMFMESVLGAGALTSVRGERDGFWDIFYFSIASYSTLGIGDIVPQGPMRIVAGIESLNGLVLIAWSSSFTYLAMEKTWGKDGLKPSE
ncbi:MAG: potassium channel family protein [Pacificimonas sp.]